MLTLTQRKKRHLRIRNLLLSGRSASDVATTVGVSRKLVYDYANEHDLPTNPTVREGCQLENDIFTASQVCTLDELSRAYNIAKPLLRRIVERARRRWTKDMKQWTALLFLPLLLPLHACTTVSQPKTIGDQTFYTYRDVTLSGPSTSAIVVTNLDGTKVLGVHPFAGESVLAEIVPGAALVWAAHELDADRNQQTSYTGASSNQSTNVEVTQNPMPMGGGD